MGHPSVRTGIFKFRCSYRAHQEGRKEDIQGGVRPWLVQSDTLVMMVFPVAVQAVAGGSGYTGEVSGKVPPALFAAAGVPLCARVLR